MVFANVDALRTIAESVQTSRHDLEIAATQLALVDHPAARAARAKCLREAGDLGRVRDELLRRASMFASADQVMRTHRRVVKIDVRWNPAQLLAAEASRRAKRAARALINAALDGMLGRITQMAAKTTAFAHIGATAARGVFWGNFAGKENRPSNDDQRGTLTDRVIVDSTRPGGPTTVIAKKDWLYGDVKAVDPLDLCAAKHDARYKTLGITAATQFSPTGLMRTATTNLQLKNCARDKAVSSNGFDPERVDPRSHVRGEEAREGIIALFGLLGTIGTGLNDLVDQIAKLPTISRSEAQAIVVGAIGTSIKTALKTIPGIGLVTP